MIKRTDKKRSLLRVRSEEGFSLIEVLIATVLLLFGILAIVTGEVSSLTMNKRSAETIKAVSAAENILEMMRRNPKKLSEYNGMNTNNDFVKTTPLSMAQSDFNEWKSSVGAITGETKPTTEKAFQCGTTEVRSACGSIRIGSGLLDKVKSVTIQVVWPAREEGITINTAIES